MSPFQNTCCEATMPELTKAWKMNLWHLEMSFNQIVTMINVFFGQCVNLPPVNNCNYFA